MGARRAPVSRSYIPDRTLHPRTLVPKNGSIGSPILLPYGRTLSTEGLPFLLHIQRVESPYYCWGSVLSISSGENAVSASSHVSEVGR